MFDPRAEFSVVGHALGLRIEVTVALSGEDADASALIGLVRPDRTLLVDVPNVQSLLVSAINDALIKIQHMDARINGASIQDIRIGRAKAAPYTPEIDGSLQ